MNMVGLLIILVFLNSVNWVGMSTSWAEVILQPVVSNTQVASVPKPMLVNNTSEVIQAALKRGMEYLQNQQNIDGSITVRGESRFNVWETANCLYVLLSIGGYDKTVEQRAINFIKSVQRPDGGFYLLGPSDGSSYCLETSAVAILALAKSGDDVRRVVAFVLSKQLNDGSWSVGEYIPSLNVFPSVAGYALSALITQGVDDNHVPAGSIT